MSEKEGLEIHLLIGIEDYHKIQTGINTDSQTAVETIFGWTLAGRINSTENKVTQSNVLLTLEKRQTREDIQRLWDLESIGIREVAEVYEDFKDNIKFDGEIYKVSLPWKAGTHDLPDNRDYAKQ